VYTEPQHFIHADLLKPTADLPVEKERKI
jgi:hypothetical protein